MYQFLRRLYIPLEIRTYCQYSSLLLAHHKGASQLVVADLTIPISIPTGIRISNDIDAYQVIGTGYVDVRDDGAIHSCHHSTGKFSSSFLSEMSAKIAVISWTSHAKCVQRTPSLLIACPLSRTSEILVHLNHPFLY